MTNSEQWSRQVADARRDFFKVPADMFNAFEYSKQYTRVYETLIASKVAEASSAIFGTPIPSGVAVFSFGAPSRNEMLGGSDADVAVYRAGTGEVSSARAKPQRVRAVQFTWQSSAACPGHLQQDFRK